MAAVNKPGVPDTKSPGVAPAPRQQGQAVHSSSKMAVALIDSRLPDGASRWDKLPLELRQHVLWLSSTLSDYLAGRLPRLNDYAKDEPIRRRIWRDAFMMDWPGDLRRLPRIPDIQRDDLLTVCSRRMYFQLCRHFPLQSDATHSRFAEDDAERNDYDRSMDMACYNATRRLAHIPMRHGWFDLLDFSYPIAMAVFAIRFGHLRLLRHLVVDLGVVDLHKLRWSHPANTPLDTAMRGGHVDVFVFLFEQGVTECSPRVTGQAARYGLLSVLVWLHDNKWPQWSTDAMDNAAGNGQLHVVQWLHANRPEGCTVKAVDMALSGGHEHVARFLLEHRTEGCTPFGMDKMAAQGNIGMLELMARNPKIRCTTDAIDDAAANGHLATVKWLLAHRHEGFTWQGVGQAATDEIAQLLVSTLSREQRRRMVVDATGHWNSETALRRLNAV